MSAHTPAPWTIHAGGGHAYPSIRGSDSIHTNGRQRNAAGISSASYSEEVCEIRADLELPGPQANARLICAAPDLLEACKSALDGLYSYRSLEGNCSAMSERDKLEAAIKKAEGDL